MPKGISETEFASQVEDLLKIHHWKWIHFRPAWSSKGWRTPIKGDKGFPDYVAVRNGICLFLELKGGKGKLSLEQEEWARELQTTANNSLGVMYFLWRPADYEKVVEILT